MYGAVDPVFMIMLIRMLGPGYAVWDKAASIRFVRPGRGHTSGNLHDRSAKVESIRTELASQSKTERVYGVELKDAAGVVHAIVEKRLFIARRSGVRVARARSGRRGLRRFPDLDTPPRRPKVDDPIPFVHRNRPRSNSSSSKHRPSSPCFGFAQHAPAMHGLRTGLGVTADRAPGGVPTARAARRFVLQSGSHRPGLSRPARLPAPRILHPHREPRNARKCSRPLQRFPLRRCQSRRILCPRPRSKRAHRQDPHGVGGPPRPTRGTTSTRAVSRSLHAPPCKRSQMREPRWPPCAIW